jgi:hypothetical protein
VLQNTAPCFSALNITNDVVHNWRKYDLRDGGRFGMNLEFLLMTYFKSVELQVDHLCHTGFTTNTPSDGGAAQVVHSVYPQLERAWQLAHSVKAPPGFDPFAAWFQPLELKRDVSWLQAFAFERVNLRLYASVPAGQTTRSLPVAI